MVNSYRTEKIDPSNYTDQDWMRAYDFRLTCDKLKKVHSAFKEMEPFKEFHTRTIKESSEEKHMVWKNDQANGLFIFERNFEDDLAQRFTMFLNYMVEQELEPSLLELVFEQFLKYDEKSNALAIQSKDGKCDFVENLYKAELGSISELFELNVKEAEIEKIDAWLAKAPLKFPNLTIQFYDYLPDDLLEEYAAFFSQMMEDLPATQELGDTIVTAERIKLDQEVEKLGNFYSYRYFIYNENKELIAMTMVGVDIKRPQVVDQYMTGVAEKYRGRGLSKWLKAAMFKKLIADFPALEKMNTETHPVNHASRELSKQMGYKKVGSVKVFLIDRTSIVQLLNSKT